MRNPARQACHNEKQHTILLRLTRWYGSPNETIGAMQAKTAFLLVRVDGAQYTKRAGQLEEG
jgi:hypothetical protein